MKKIALLFPGQGAQSVGMGRDLAEQYGVAADLFGDADEILGRNLSEIAWTGPVEELTKTSNCQPALYVHGLAALAVLPGQWIARCTSGDRRESSCSKWISTETPSYGEQEGKRETPHGGHGS